MLRRRDFKSGIGSVRDYGSRYGICELCGKGDSRDDGGNEDKLRYAFKLSNIKPGGRDLWCGSTCIINHALKVEGALTAEHAKSILEKTLREHMALWKVEHWRATHPMHVKIDAQYAALCQESSRLKYRAQAEHTYAKALGVDPYTLKWDVYRLVHTFGTSARFYRRRGHLTEQKMIAWRKAVGMLDALAWLKRTLDAAYQHSSTHNERLAFLAEEKRKRDEYLTARKTRKPRNRDDD